MFRPPISRCEFTLILQFFYDLENFLDNVASPRAFLVFYNNKQNFLQLIFLFAADFLLASKMFNLPQLLQIARGIKLLDGVRKRCL